METTEAHRTRETTIPEETAEEEVQEARVKTVKWTEPVTEAPEWSFHNLQLSAVRLRDGSVVVVEGERLQVHRPEPVERAEAEREVLTKMEKRALLILEEEEADHDTPAARVARGWCS